MMQNYLLKTRHNEPDSNSLQLAVNDVGLSAITIEEAHEESNRWILKLGVKSVPTVAAVHDGVLIHQSSSPFQMGSFQADADTKLAEYLA